MSTEAQSHRWCSKYTCTEGMMQEAHKISYQRVVALFHTVGRVMLLIFL